MPVPEDPRKWALRFAQVPVRIVVAEWTQDGRLALSKDGSFEIHHVQSVAEKGHQRLEYSLYGIQNTPAELAAFLEQKQVAITSWGLCCCLTSLIASGLYSLSDVETHFRGRYWREAQFIK